MITVPKSNTPFGLSFWMALSVALLIVVVPVTVTAPDTLSSQIPCPGLFELLMLLNFRT